MSDPTPDDLYEALRKRLADYGQEPPPDMWAGIRQQLPLPVAVPRRRRWRAGLVLLLLVCVVASLATWQWQRLGSVAGKSGSVAQRANTSEKQAASANSASEHPANKQEARIASAPIPAPAGPGPGDASNQSVSSSVSSSNAQNIENQLTETDKNLNVSELITNNSLNKRQKVGVSDAGSAAKSVTPAVASAAAPTGRPARRNRALAVAGVEPSGLEARQRRLLRAGRSTPPTTTALARPGEESALGAGRVSRPTVAGRRPQAGAIAASSVTTAGADAPRVAAAAVARPAAGSVERQAGASPAAVIPAQSLAEAPSESAQPGAWHWLALRVTGLQVPAGAALRTPQPVEVSSLPPLVPAVVSRWAVQLVVGPGLTYRHLGTASGLSYAPNSLATPVLASPGFSNGANNVVRTTTVSSAASLERPALGYGAQLSIRRTLTPHWTVSTGLGYAEYATALALRQVSAAQITRASYDFAFLDSLSRASGTTIRQRDTYRFLTVPLRVGYAWSTGQRWQVGLLGGFDAAIYLGGTSSEGSACACQTQTWGATGSPYRSLSLAASLGAEVRYRLAGPWQLLAQPTASYLLTPLAKPTSGYSIRHLLGGTALLGMSYDLP